MDRTTLPFRNVTESFLIYQGKLVAQDRGHYLQLVGGGIAAGEDATTATLREAKEEVGAQIATLHPIDTITWVWPSSWADTPKRKERFQRYQGEKVHFLVGKVLAFDQKTTLAKDAWQGDKLMSWDKAMAYTTQFHQQAHPYARAYKLYQMAIIKTLATLSHGQARLPLN